MSSVASKQYFPQGFTMVELLVVLAIGGILLSLVGPFTINQLNNVKRAQEREEIVILLEEWQFRAYHEHLTLQISFSGHSLRVYELPSHQKHSVLHTYKPKHLSIDAVTPRTLINVFNDPNTVPIAEYEFALSVFPQQQMHINAHGFVTNLQVTLQQGERNFIVKLDNIGKSGEANDFN